MCFCKGDIILTSLSTDRQHYRAVLSYCFCPNMVLGWFRVWWGLDLIMTSKEHAIRFVNNEWATKPLNYLWTSWKKHSGELLWFQDWCAQQYCKHYCDKVTAQRRGNIIAAHMRALWWNMLSTVDRRQHRRRGRERADHTYIYISKNSHPMNVKGLWVKFTN